MFLPFLSCQRSHARSLWNFSMCLSKLNFVLKSNPHWLHVVWLALWILASSIVLDSALQTTHLRWVFLCFSNAVPVENTFPHSSHVDPVELCFISMCLFKKPSFLYSFEHSPHLKMWFSSSRRDVFKMSSRGIGGFSVSVTFADSFSVTWSLVSSTSFSSSCNDCHLNSSLGSARIVIPSHSRLWIS